MWAWLIGGWIVVAGVLAVLHHRLRRTAPGLPAEVEEFLVRLEMELTSRHPDIAYLGLLPGQFTALLRVRGQETMVALHEPWRHAQAFPDAFGAMVDRLVKDIEDIGLDRVGDHDFATVATWILPQIRGREWVEAQGTFGDSGLVHRLLTPELAVVYVIDDPQSMVFVCRAHLQNWRKSESDLHSLALTNLRRLGDLGAQPIGAEPVHLHTGDGYDAARLLLLEDQRDSLLVAIPDRDTLWVAQEEGQDLAALMAATSQQASRSSHPISGELYRLQTGQLQRVSAGSPR